MHVFLEGARKGMVCIGKVAFRVLLEEPHRVDPEETPFVLPDEAAPATELGPDQAHYGLRAALLVGCDDDDVRLPRPSGGTDTGTFALAQEFVEWSRHPGQALPAGALCQHDKLVEFLAGQVDASGHCHPAYDAATVEDPLENLRLGSSQNLSQVGYLQVVTEVRLVGAVFEPGFLGR